MTEIKEFYKFDKFCLDRSNKVLKCGEQPVPLTPKVFETLLYFIENQGRLLEKDELMQHLWKDSFVEESNLTFNIKMLRKALGDNASCPTFIETIPRRGYRFIAEVAAADEESGSLVEPQTIQSARIFSRSNLLFIIVLMTFVSSIVFASWFWRNQSAAANVPILSNKFELIKLTDTGKVYQTAISPDGKFIAYCSEVNGKQSLWLRQLETNVNTNLVPPSSDKYFGLKFSHDGQRLFFTRKITGQPISLFSISVFGGVPHKVVGVTQGGISISPDDKKIAFVRDDGKPDQYSLYLIDVDGKNERLIKESEIKKVYWAFDFSPDGKTIAAAVGQTDNASQDVSLIEINVETGQQRQLTDEKFFNVTTILWLPDKSGLIIGANERISEPARLWQIDYPGGKTSVLSTDSMNYTNLTLTRESHQLGATVVDADFHLFVADVAQPDQSVELAQARDGFAFTSDDRIVFASDISGNEDLWVMNLDGTDQRQLTMDKHLDAYPFVSRDNRHIYFTSNRSGQMQVWRMNPDGTEQTQITRHDGGYPVFVSEDGKYLIYQKALQAGFWRFSLENGSETEITARKTIYYTAFSPDGKNMAFVARNKEAGTYRIDVMEIETGKIIKTFPAGDEKHCPIYLNWLPHDNGLNYLSQDSTDRTWLWTQKLGEAKPASRQLLGSEEIMNSKYSRDGKKLAFVRGAWKHDAVLLKGLR